MIQLQDRQIFNRTHLEYHLITLSRAWYAETYIHASIRMHYITRISDLGVFVARVLSSVEFRYDGRFARGDNRADKFSPVEILFLALCVVLN
ncbi:hypothetical protein ALC62_00946 [Cyphomyrmex costatus]|uniref:Uncharacterized protein n=1 Tax=Cyphomyrmex costatus TaxID=456900 RepID=A0A195D5H0_9HYME|nr:hypothetical protein ALC62_00946 [Cyphomyrmex costatus]